MKQARQSKLANPTLIYTQSGLREMCALLRTRPLIALDTESDSLYSYYPKVCLIQISTFADPDDTDPQRVLDYLVDPLRLTRLDELGELLADPTQEVVMHAAENDIFTLQRDFSFRFHHIFDTQLAARILGWQKVGLAKMLESNFGLISDKRMQRTNWGKRPLTPQQISYAQMDTHYLPALRARQIEELKAAHRWEEAQDAFRQLATLDYSDRGNNERTMWSMRDVRKVPAEDTGVLEALWEWREHEAQHQNRPPFKIAGDSTLIRLAASRPTTPAALDAEGILSDSQVNRYGRQILETIQAGTNRPLPSPPTNNHRPETLVNGKVQRRFEALRSWRTKKAKERGVTADIVFTNSTLMEIAQHVPMTVAALETIPDVGPWKAKTYGPEIFPILKKKQ